MIIDAMLDMLIFAYCFAASLIFYPYAFALPSLPCAMPPFSI